VKYNPSWKLKIAEIVNKFPDFYGNQKFITEFTAARHVFCTEPDNAAPVLTPFFFKINCIIPSYT
jgi:hypothetical protein